MGKMCYIELYGLKCAVSFVRTEDEKEVKGLLRLFLRDRLDKIAFYIDYEKEKTPQEIGTAFFPHLSKIDIWGIHAAGFHFEGTHLVVGPSDSGKSVLTYTALKNGFNIIGDDVTLARDQGREIELLPFFSKIFLQGKSVSPDLNAFKPGILKSIIFPKLTRNSAFVKRIKDKKTVMKRLVPQFLWSYEEDIQQKQKVFLLRLCNYPAYEVCWNKKFLKDISLFRKLMDEII